MANRDTTIDALDKAGMNIDEASKESKEVKEGYKNTYGFAVADVGDFDLDQDRSIVPSIEHSLKQAGIDAIVDGDEHSQAAFSVNTDASEDEVKDALEKDGIYLETDIDIDPDYSDPGEMDGDHDSAMTSVGWGSDEDYGYYGESKRLKELAGIPTKKE